MNTFLIIRADGSQLSVNAQISSQSQYENTKKMDSFSSNKEYKERQIQLSIFHALRDIEEYKIDIEENQKILETDCQYILDTYEGVYGLQIMNEIHGSGTNDLEMKFLIK